MTLDQIPCIQTCGQILYSQTALVILTSATLINKQDQTADEHSISRYSLITACSSMGAVFTPLGIPFPLGVGQAVGPGSTPGLARLPTSIPSPIGV